MPLAKEAREDTQAYPIGHRRGQRIHVVATEGNTLVANILGQP